MSETTSLADRISNEFARANEASLRGLDLETRQKVAHAIDRMAASTELALLHPDKAAIHRRSVAMEQGIIATALARAAQDIAAEYRNAALRVARSVLLAAIG